MEWVLHLLPPCMCPPEPLPSCFTAFLAFSEGFFLISFFLPPPEDRILQLASIVQGSQKCPAVAGFKVSCIEPVTGQTCL